MLVTYCSGVSVFPARNSRSKGGRGTGLPYAGAVVREGVCTENLTPWLKLLPCRDQSGLAALLQNRGRLLSGSYQVEHICICTSTYTPTALNIPQSRSKDTNIFTLPSLIAKAGLAAYSFSGISCKAQHVVKPELLGVCSTCGVPAWVSRQTLNLKALSWVGNRVRGLCRCWECTSEWAQMAVCT